MLKKIFKSKSTIKPTIYLHIGTNKTGTSFIQNTLIKNYAVLREYGILYPKAGLVDSAHYGLSDALGFSLNKGNNTGDAKLSAKIKQKLLQEITASAANTVIFSSEIFMLNKELDLIKQFLETFEVKIIVYLRRHDDWWESAYNQAVKTVVSPPWKIGVREYLTYQKKKNPKFGDYRLLINRWAEAFGKENILVRPFETQQNQPTIVDDFFTTMQLEAIPAKLKIPPIKINQSLDDYTLSMIDSLQRANINPDLRRKMIAYVLDKVSYDSNTTLINPKLRLKLIANNTPAYEYIAKEFLNRADGKLFVAPLPSIDTVWKPIRKPTPAEAIEMTLASLKI